MAPKAAAADPKAKPKAKGKAKAKVEEEDEGPKMEAPSKELFDAALKEIQDTIEGFQAQQAELATKISEKSGGKDEYFAKRSEYRAQLDEFTKKIDELMERKGALNKGINDKKAEGVSMRTELSKMKKSIGYNTEGDIDDRIAQIELWMRTESLTLKEEKDYLKEIQELKRNRPKVGKVAAMEEGLASRDTGANLRENIGSIKEELDLYRDGKRKVSAAMAELNASRQDQLGDLPKYIEKRDEIGKKVKAQMDERNTLRDEFRQKEREFNQWRNDQRKKKQDKINEERQSKQAEWEMHQRARKAEAMDQQPYVSEITLIEQTILFCKNLVKDTGPAQEVEKKETTHTNPEGSEVLLKKEDREEEFYYAPTAAKKKGKSKNKGGKDGGAKPIKHNAVTFKLFDELKLSAPITTADIPEKLEQLQEKLEYYQEKVKVWEKERDDLKAKIMSGQVVDLAEEKKEEEKEEEKAEEEEEKEEAKEEEEKADDEEAKADEEEG